MSITTTQLSITQYRKKYKKCSAAAIKKAIVDNKYNRLPYVIKAEKIGRDWILTLNCSL
jgi:hypothetical protein